MLQSATMKRFWPTQQSKQEWMIDAIRNEARLSARYTGRESISEKVLEAMREIPRHRFVPPVMRAAAYDNTALPVGCGQTISQPFIVALMTDLLDLKGGERVLEVGTGTGYQTAILARLGAEVFSIEYLPELSKRARRRLQELGLMQSVHLRVGNGWQGWPDDGEFDAIIVTAAPPRIPEALIEQLAIGGRMVLPVGPAGQSQQLLRVKKDAQGNLDIREILPVVFVPLIGDDKR